ncbi:hypothetical protein [Billgrantia tianxiuensis]|uniref:hypothetical protein n=1 Tax=Billgrantia tianxiuensis TaxID=2497861 RepID=UPI001F3180C1|nr:hypothetical protein [Halomonas tianxiuensis]
MKLITFDAFRTLGIPGVRYIKPERMYDHLDEIRGADWLLFPEYWQLNTLIHGLKARIFPSLASYQLGHDKVEQTRAFQALFPEHVPPTEILGASPRAIERVEERFGYPFIAKRIKSSMGEGVNLIDSRPALEAYLATEPVLYAQLQLPIDRDLRIVLVGGELLAAYWRITPPGGYRSNVSQGGSIDHRDIPPRPSPWPDSWPRPSTSTMPASTSPWWTATPWYSNSTGCSATRASPTAANASAPPSCAAWNATATSAPTTSRRSPWRADQSPRSRPPISWARSTA